ncbi:MAG: DUF1080 domain-containing protein [Balneolaceae bacterium]
MNSILRFSGILSTLLLFVIFTGNHINDEPPVPTLQNHPQPNPLVATGQPGESDFTPLFNGKNFDGWYSFIPEFGRNNDPDQVFNVKDEMIYITGRHFGYIATEKIYRNFHLKLEFKWGEEKWPPRLEEKRDSGICYHFPDEAADEVWPVSVECQIQEGDTGDFWLIGHTTIEVDGEANEPQDFARIVKKHDMDKPHGSWNTIEVISYEGSNTHIVNGVVVNHGENASVQTGRILLQSEGAEIYFRNVKLKEL